MKIKILNSDKGFTLIEVLTAMVVLAIGIMALYSMQISSIQGNAKASRITTAATWNAGQMEGFIGMKYSDAPLRDTNSNGTNQDPDGDGIDAVGVAGFGLDDTGAAADGSFTTADGRYLLYWNVAVDVPMANLKTIRIHVQDSRQAQSNPVTFTYIKNNTI